MEIYSFLKVQLKLIRNFSLCESFPLGSATLSLAGSRLHPTFILLCHRFVQLN